MRQGRNTHGKTGVLFFPAFDWAISPTHPEREERLLYTRDQIFEEGIMDFPQIQEYFPQMATDADIARVHFQIPDLTRRITDAHRIAAGSAILLADEVMKGNIKNAFSIVRPPGHHSMTVMHGNRGFCDINNEAIMIEAIRKKYGVRKVAIVDTDVHHGDGTQDIFWNDPDVLFISFHQDGRTLYPGTGFIREAGGPLAYGRTLNIPLNPHTTDVGILYVLENLVLPLLEDFQPELVVNSAGQDNHYTDPLASMAFSAQGYARLNDLLKPDIAVLEGGYSVQTALPYVNMALIMAFAGIDYRQLREPGAPAPHKESAANMDYLKKTVQELKDIYAQHEEKKETFLEEAKRRSGAFARQPKNIFYDTDSIYEKQERLLKLCPNCCGWQAFDSSGEEPGLLPQNIYAVSIPLYACESCRAEAIAHYQHMCETEAREYDFIYLQDKANDLYKRYHCSHHTESQL